MKTTGSQASTGSPPTARPRLRVALYSHDALGLGHIRRNLAIARALAVLDPAPDVLLLTGAPEAVTANRPENCELVSLPALSKDSNGGYTARHLSVDEAEVLEMRRSILTAALTSFKPDVLIVDKHPRGFNQELEPALKLLRRRGTRVVLGLRDVLDDAITSRREWDADRSSQALRRWYHQVWVYGDRQVHDLGAELDLPRAVYTGYLANGRCPAGAPTSVSTPYVLAMVGGGADGKEVAEAFVRAELPAGHHGVLVTGPQMPAADVASIRAAAEDRPEMAVHTYVDDSETLLAGAAAVVAMGGYNTVCEAMAAGSRLLVVPRVTPRQEQLVRARLLTAAGILEHLPPDDLTSEKLSTWICDAVARSGSGSKQTIDLDGLARLPQLLLNLSDTKEGAHVA